MPELKERKRGTVGAKKITITKGGSWKMGGSQLCNKKGQAESG